MNFRDGYIFALCDQALHVWKGDLESGVFNKVLDGGTLQYIQTASPSQIQDLVTFKLKGSQLQAFLTDIDKNKGELILTIDQSEIAGVDRPVFSNDLDQTFLQTKDKLYQIMTNTKDRVETIRYSLPNGPYESPAVNNNGEVYFKDGNQWKKKTYKFQSEATYISLQSINLNREEKEVEEEPERKNLYVIGIIVVLFFIGGSVGFAISRCKQHKDGAPAEEANTCSQNIGTADVDDFDPRIAER